MARLTATLVLMGILIVVLASCVAAPRREAGVQGVVLAVRPVPEAEAAATRAVLAALDAGRGDSRHGRAGRRQPASSGAARPAAEVLVRDQGGGVISVVEPAAARFHPGERVTIIKRPSPRLVRTGSGQAALHQQSGDRAWAGIDRTPRKS